MANKDIEINFKTNVEISDVQALQKELDAIKEQLSSLGNGGVDKESSAKIEGLRRSAESLKNELSTLSFENIESAQASVAELKNKVDSLNSSENQLGATLESTTEKISTQSEAVKESTTAIEAETESVLKNSSAKLESASASQKTGSSLRGLSSTFNKLKGLLGKKWGFSSKLVKWIGKLRGLAKSAKGAIKVLDRGLGLYAIVTALGVAFGKGVEKVGSMGSALREFGERAKNAGAIGGSLMAWVGSMTEKLSGLGKSIQNFFNPLNALKESTNQLIAAKERLAKIEREAFEAKAAAKNYRKATEAIKEEIKNAKKLEKAKKRFIAQNKEWSDSIYAVNDALDKQIELFEDEKDHEKEMINRQYDDKRAEVDNKRDRGEISESQARQNKAELDKEEKAELDKIDLEIFNKNKEALQKRKKTEIDVRDEKTIEKEKIDAVLKDMLTESEKEQAKKIIESINNERIKVNNQRTQEGLTDKQRDVLTSRLTDLEKERNHEKQKLEKAKVASDALGEIIGEKTKESGSEALKKLEKEIEAHNRNINDYNHEVKRLNQDERQRREITTNDNERISKTNAKKINEAKQIETNQARDKRTQSQNKQRQERQANIAKNDRRASAAAGTFKSIASNLNTKAAFQQQIAGIEHDINTHSRGEASKASVKEIDRLRKSVKTLLDSLVGDNETSLMLKNLNKELEGIRSDVQRIKKTQRINGR